MTRESCSHTFPCEKADFSSDINEHSSFRMSTIENCNTLSIRSNPYSAILPIVSVNLTVDLTKIGHG